MITATTEDDILEIHPIREGELEAVLGVYLECEDFLVLGPVAKASLEMVLKDIEISKEEGGLFCGIYRVDGRMIGVVDYVPNHYQADRHLAYLSLLMIAAPYRDRGIGRSVVEAVEVEICKDAQVTSILAGVQVNNPLAVQFWQRMGYRIVSEPRLMPDQTTVFDLRKDLLKIEVAPASINDKPVLRNLLELCQHDYSEYDNINSMSMACSGTNTSTTTGPSREGTHS